MLLSPTTSTEQIFTRELSLLFTQNYGPHHDHGLNLVAIARSATRLHPALELALHNSLRKQVGRSNKSVKEVFSPTVREWLSRMGKKSNTLPKFFRAFQDNIRSKVELDTSGDPDQHRRKRFSSDVDEIRRDCYESMVSQRDLYWERLRVTEAVFQFLPLSIELSFNITLTNQWREALSQSLGGILPAVFKKYLDPDEWTSLALRLNQNEVSNEDASFAAWLVLFDIWVFLRKGYPTGDDSPIADILRYASISTQPMVSLAFALRNCFIGADHSASDFCNLIENNVEVAAILRSIGWPIESEIANAKVKDIHRKHVLLPPVKSVE
jgi:hypothetical protein